jgi:lipopolysaccharide/colanic/teichoic acid biosynthesis glycosyltransferase
VDRNKHILSLLLFTVGKHSENSEALKKFLNLLVKRIRSTDEIGWLDRNRIGVILPYTSYNGAHNLARAICKIPLCKTVIVEYAIHNYPDSPSSDDDFLVHSNIRELPQKSKSIRPASPTPAIELKQEDLPTTPPPTMVDLYNSGASSKSIERLVIRPHPIWKRAIDISASVLGLVILSPLLLVVTLIIKFWEGGPVIYKQKRVGYSKRVFTMWKFRTMKPGGGNELHQNYMSDLIDGANDESSAKAMTKLDSELPITGFGRLLRATCIDELPQLINVLRGDMSLIGPRPPTLYEARNYSQWHCERFGCVPGMTGLWQVSGKNKLTFLEMIRLDIKYVRELSLWLDIVILLKTPITVAYEIKDLFNLHRHRLSLEDI